MLVEFANQTAVVTGGTGGIGSVVVKLLLEAGAKVAIVDLNQASLDKKVAELESLGTVKGYALNLSNVEEIAPVVSAIRADLGEISVLVQCAGLMGGKAGLDVTQADWDLSVNINARGCFFMMQQVIGQSMQKIGGGSVVNFASMAGIRGMHPPMCNAMYSAAKAAVIGITRQGAVEWASLGVRVNAVVPGGVLTGAMATMTPPPEIIDRIPMRKLNKPEDIAHAVLFLASDKAATITGQDLVIDGGASVVGY